MDSTMTTSGAAPERALTMQDIERAAKQLQDFAFPEPRPMFGRDFLRFGLEIMEVAPRIEPKIKLGDAAPVSDAFRAEFDAWLLAMFGVRELFRPVPLGMAYQFGNTVVMNPEDVVKISSI